MPRPPVKKTRVLAEAQEYGETLGRLKANAHWKELIKGNEQSVRAHIGKFIDSMATKIDPLELAAVGASAFLIHTVLEGSIDIINKITDIASSPAAQSVVDWLTKGNLLWLLDYTTPKPRQGGGSYPFPNPNFNVGGGGGVDGSAPQPIISKNELLLWAVSFLVAFVAIRYGPAMVQSVGGLTGLANLFIGGLALGA